MSQGYTTYITDRYIYEQVILKEVPKTSKYLWIATSDIKDMYVSQRNRRVPFLQVLSNLLDQGILIRLLHAKEPGKNFRVDFDRYPALVHGLERMLCPRVHFKSIIIDGKFVYSGSANLTGAGLGAKSSARRNFEGGIISTDPHFVKPVMEQFDQVWMGSHCRNCGRKKICPDGLYDYSG